MCSISILIFISLWTNLSDTIQPTPGLQGQTDPRAHVQRSPPPPEHPPVRFRAEWGPLSDVQSAARCGFTRIAPWESCWSPVSLVNMARNLELSFSPLQPYCIFLSSSSLSSFWQLSTHYCLPAQKQHLRQNKTKLTKTFLLGCFSCQRCHTLKSLLLIRQCNSCFLPSPLPWRESEDLYVKYYFNVCFIHNQLNVLSSRISEARKPGDPFFILCWDSNSKLFFMGYGVSSASWLMPYW